jgi:RNA polymerase sigma-70 factor (ECF subfamily)
MLRITEVAMENGIATLRIEGRLTQATAGALRASLEGRRAPRLDLSRVQFADRVGLGAVEEALAGGGTLVACSGLVRELLDKAPPAVPSGNPDGELVAALRRGDAGAFETLVRVHGGRLLAVARRFLPEEQDARDAVQEAFLAAFRSIAGFAGSSKLSTWLHRIAVNAALMKLRSRGRRREQPIDDLLPHFDDDGHRGGAVPAWAPAVDELAQRQETRALVRGAIDRLPASYRTVLLLRDIEERDTEETAALLGVTAQAVKTRLHRARQALRTLLERELVAA